MNRDTKSMVSESQILCAPSGLRVSAPWEALGLIIAVSLSGLFSSFPGGTVLCSRYLLVWGGIRSVSLLQREPELVRNSRRRAVGGRDVRGLALNGEEAKYVMCQTC